MGGTARRGQRKAWPRPRFHTPEPGAPARGATTGTPFAAQGKQEWLCYLRFRVVEEELIAVGIVDDDEAIAPPTVLDGNALGFEFCA